MLLYLPLFTLPSSVLRFAYSLLLITLRYSLKNVLAHVEIIVVKVKSNLHIMITYFTEILVPPQDEDSPDPILSAGLFEGDIAGVNESDFSSFEKNAIRDMRKRWPGGIIPYVISGSFSK